MTARPAIFLDRDGVILEHRQNYVRNWDEAVFYTQALNALAAISSKPVHFFVITNQSIIGRGEIAQSIVDDINSRMVKTIEWGGGRIDRVYTCPHAPHDYCECRKPQPGMILRAMDEFKIDAARSVVIGDSITDLQAGQNAGLGRLILVRTGRGTTQEALLAQGGLPHALVSDDLADALRRCLDWLGTL